MISRRRFLAASGRFAAAAGLAPGILKFAQQDEERRIGYCIVGLGRISMGEFMPAAQRSTRSRLVAFVSGHRDKALREASKYGVDPDNIYDYEHYERIADDPNIDAVYIALPNFMHAEYTVRAAKAGKHVFCEKPMANSPAEAEDMIAACRQADRKLMIGYRCQYEPTNLKAIELIRSGAIGRPEIIEGSFGFNERLGEWRLNKKMAGGGPLVDVGIYCLNASRYLTGEEPVEIFASTSSPDKDGRFTQVEENLTWSMKFPSGTLANLSTSYGYTGEDWIKVTGSKGWLRLEPAFAYTGLHLVGSGASGGTIDFAPDDPEPNQFVREADHFADCILHNRQPKTPGEEGLRDERLISAIYKSVATGRPVTV